MGIKMLRLPGPGKNLFNFEIIKKPQMSMAQDGTITITTGDGSAWTGLPQIVLPAGTYTLWMTGDVGFKFDGRNKAGKYVLTGAIPGGGVFSNTFTLSEEASFGVKLEASDNVYPKSAKVMIVKGSVAPTEYEPYQEYLYKPGVVYQRPSRNLFDKSAATNGYTKSDGTVEVVNWYKVSDYIDVEGLDNITIQNSTGSTSSTRHYCFYTGEKVFISGRQENNTTVTIAVPSNAKYLRVPVSPSCLDLCQVEVGTKETEYEPYGFITIQSFLQGGNA